MDLIARIPGDRRPVAKRSIQEQISDKLAYMIHSGLLQPGDELPSERQLSATLGVSRETVRGALATLQSQQMVEVNHGARTRVIGPGLLPLYESVSTLNDLRGRSFEEVAEARAAVEVQVVWLAAQRISAEEMDRLATLVEQQGAMLDDPVRFQISDREFHFTLYRACGNGLLVDVVSDFYDYALELRRRVLSQPGAIARSVADHRGLVRGLRSRRPASAVAAMQVHLEQIRRSTFEEMNR